MVGLSRPLSAHGNKDHILLSVAVNDPETLLNLVVSALLLRLVLGLGLFEFGILVLALFLKVIFARVRVFDQIKFFFGNNNLVFDPHRKAVHDSYAFILV